MLPVSSDSVKARRTPPFQGLTWGSSRAKVDTSNFGPRGCAANLHAITYALRASSISSASGADSIRRWSRITGSRAFAAVARAVVAFARDPGADDGSCVISQAKNNLSRLDLPSLRYLVDWVTLDTADGPGQWGRLRITGEADIHVEAILREDDTTGEDRTDAAAAWLEDYLTANGGHAVSADIRKPPGRSGSPNASWPAPGRP